MTHSDPLARPGLPEIREAAERIAPFARRTPVLTSHCLDELSGARLFFKCENFQKSGSFKFRGACNAVFALSDDDARRGVVTHSSGNHAAALALAARLRGIPATIVVPANAPRAKIEAVRAYGGLVELCEPTLAAREAGVEAIQAKTGATLVHPYDNAWVIAGQGTAALELLDEVPDLDAIIVPISGGGLISGNSIAAIALQPGIEVFGAEPERADDASRSFRSGRLEPLLSSDTIADGLRATLCARTLAIIRQHVTDVLTMSEDEISDTMRMVWHYLKIVVESSGVVPLAAVLSHRERFAGRRVGVLFSGGNLDLDRLPWQS
jgi:threonine dehydratase